MMSKRQGIGPRVQELRNKARLRVEELEPRCLLSSNSLLPPSVDLVSTIGVGLASDDFDFFALFPGATHSSLLGTKHLPGTVDDSSTVAVLGQDRFSSTSNPGHGGTSESSLSQSPSSLINPRSGESEQLFLAASIASGRGGHGNNLLPGVTLLRPVAQVPNQSVGSNLAASSNILNKTTRQGEGNLPGIEKQATAFGGGYTLNHDTTLSVAAANGLLTNSSSDIGNPMTASLVTGPSSGLLTLNSDGSFVYTPNSHFVGTDSFVYQVSDGTGSPSQATATIAVVNHAPYTFDQIYSVNHDHSLTVGAAGVLDGATDAEGDALSAALVSGPSHGSLTFNTNGSFTYTPNSHFVGSDTFTYKANDTLLDSNIATATVNVTNNAPLPTAQAYTTTHDHSLVISAPGILAGSSDPEGDPLTPSLVSTTSHGALSLNGNGSFTYTPNAHFVGTDSFSYKLNDGVADSLPATVFITVVNHAPVALGHAYTLTHDTIFNSGTQGVLANDSDVEDGSSLTAALVTGPSHGTLTLNGNGTFVYTPTLHYYGSDSFTYQANDGTATNNLSNIATVTLTVLEQRPFAVGAAFNSFQNLVITNTTPLTAISRDGDGDTLTASVVSGPTHGTLQSFSSNGTFSYNPGSYIGSDSFTYQVSDGLLTSTAATVVFNIVPPIVPNPAPAAPTNSSQSPSTNPEVGGVSYLVTHDHTLNGNALDVIANPAGQTLTVTLVSGPSHGTMTLNSDGSFTYIPTAHYFGTDTFSYQATNGGGPATLRCP